MPTDAKFVLWSKIHLRKVNDSIFQIEIIAIHVSFEMSLYGSCRGHGIAYALLGLSFDM